MFDLFDSEEDKAEREALAQGSAEFLDSLDNSLHAQKTIFYCVLANVFFFAFAFFAAQWIYNQILEMQILIYLVLFTIGFLFTFSAFRLYQMNFSKKRERKNIDAEIMGGYQYYSYQQSKWIIWLISTASGIFNVVFFTIFVSILI